MSKIAIVIPQLIINNLAIEYVPNSLEVDLGLGEQGVKALSGGAGIIDTVYFKNSESNIGGVKFKRYSRDETILLMQDWKALGNVNLIQVQAETGNVFTFQFMALTNRIELMIGSEETTQFEFQGNPAITN
jgi:hypothetical protein